MTSFQLDRPSSLGEDTFLLSRNLDPAGIFWKTDGPGHPEAFMLVLEGDKKHQLAYNIKGGVNLQEKKKTRQPLIMPKLAQRTRCLLTQSLPPYYNNFDVIG